MHVLTPSFPTRRSSDLDVALRGMEDLPQVRALRRLLGELRGVVARLDVARANEVAAHLLRALGHAVLGWMLLRAARADREARSDGPRAWMRFYFSQLFYERDRQSTRLNYSNTITPILPFTH